MIGMKQYPDKCFDLAVVDPPYGIEWKSVFYNQSTKNNVAEWDIKPNKGYFIELKRISKEWLIFGINYFIDCFQERYYPLVWDKKNGNTHIADGELVGTSIKTPLRIFSHAYFGKYHPEPIKIHPTQKPVALYGWIYKNYLPNGGKVIDTHLGSGSNRIAADKAGNIDFTGFEIDKDYYEAQEKRWKNYKAQLNLFTQ